MGGVGGHVGAPHDDDDGARVTFFVDGRPVEACPGETIATALLAAGTRTLRRTAGRGEPRGLYCVMGVCWECGMLVAGRTVRACVTPATPGLVVETLGREPA
jgi:aerobic-type carbon monoxide dehydrogenase small subunit (CoxS/CutS family)